MKILKTVKANSFIIAFEKFAKNASVSGIIWRSPEIASLSNIILKRPILDLGCGDGRFTKIMFKDKLDYGLDLSEKDIELAKKVNSHFQYLVGDAHKIGLPNKSIQTVFSNSVVEHITNLEGVLKEISRVLKSNGNFIFTTHAPSSKNFWGSKFLYKLGLNFIGVRYENFFVKQLQLKTLWGGMRWEKELRKVGLEIVELKTTTPPISSFLYEFFMPFTFIQNRISILKVIPFGKFIYSLLNPNLSTVKNGRNFYIIAKKR